MIQDNNFDEKLLGKIKSGHISPKPKWLFLLKDYVVWGIGMFALLVGGAAFSVIIYLFMNNDWGIYKKIDDSMVNFILLSLPYFWFIFLAIFMIIVNYNIRHTKKGYRYPAPVILALCVIASVFLGAIFFFLGLGQTIDYVLSERTPFYETIINPRMQNWIRPEAGRLAGLVVSVESAENRTFTIYAFDKNEWNIDAGDADIMPPAAIKVGLPLRMIGDETGELAFKARQILPAGPGQGVFERHRRERDLSPFAPKRGGPERMIKDLPPGAMPIPEEMGGLFEKYPEMKKLFEENLIKNKEMVEQLLKDSPELENDLLKMKIDPEILSELKK